ncbi:hypothetical protein RND71_037089 [Anisodus tanguticus]|uniref:Uncharacterized protein n=1 Tax=Anisodus tanguticus TaxID=243964 RepID=A0AAE1R2E8_9SOLA|nr:hypothetical protein RND71_037089 [Anisodus tanguticus]
MSASEGEESVITQEDNFSVISQEENSVNQESPFIIVRVTAQNSKNDKRPTGLQNNKVGAKKKPEGAKNGVSNPVTTKNKFAALEDEENQNKQTDNAQDHSGKSITKSVQNSSRQGVESCEGKTQQKHNKGHLISIFSVMGFSGMEKVKLWLDKSDLFDDMIGWEMFQHRQGAFKNKDIKDDFAEEV